jgi:phage tail protein X
MISHMTRFCLLAATLGCLGTTEPSTVTLPGRDGRPVLFIGNSLTYYNDLPLIVEALADSVPGLAPQERLAVSMAAYPDFGLAEHWQDGTALQALERNTWNTVVLQQGSSALDESRVILREFTKRFDAKVKAAGARTALYAVWPSAARQFDFDRVNESYTLAASDVNAMLFPVGEAWRAAWRRDANMALYSPDGLHPTVRGSYVGALVIASMLLDRSPVGMPASLRLRNGIAITIPDADASVLQQAALEAIEKFGKR